MVGISRNGKEGVDKEERHWDADSPDMTAFMWEIREGEEARHSEINNWFVTK